MKKTRGVHGMKERTHTLMRSLRCGLLLTPDDRGGGHCLLQLLPSMLDRVVLLRRELGGISTSLLEVDGLLLRGLDLAVAALAWHRSRRPGLLHPLHLGLDPHLNRRGVLAVSNEMRA